MKTLRECIEEAESEKVAIGHFNISDVVGFWAVVNAAKNLNVPVIIGVSEGERDFLGIAQARALVNTVNQNQPVFLNADHTYSLDRIKEVVDAGYDSVIIDEADKNFDENIATTKEVVEYAKSINPGTRLNDSVGQVLVESELGFIGKSSKVLDEVPDGVSMTDVEEARRFVAETGVHLFAPAVGNVHGMVKGGEPKLDIQRIRDIKAAVQIPLVLHGASGNSPEELKEAIQAGISIIHINTELRLAYKRGLQKSLSENPDEVAPYKFLRPALAEMTTLVTSKLKLFNNL